MNEVIVVNPDNVGWIESRLDSNQMDYLWKCIDNKKGDERSKLAGNISESYTLEDKDGWFSSNVLGVLLNEHQKAFGNIAGDIPTTKSHPFCLDSFWVNYQKKHEFNPLHNHGGVYSFVIWMKIPFDIEDQINLPNSKGTNMPVNSMFEFHYLDIFGRFRMKRYGLSGKDEGRILFFPSRLHHQVYPFYNCDEDRISISGNIKLDSSKTLDIPLTI